MSEMIDVVICTGTTCFVMGAGHLLNLAEELPERLRPYVSVRGSHCLGVCDDASKGKPPFATVDNVMMSSVTAEDLVAACDRALEARKGARKNAL